MVGGPFPTAGSYHEYCVASRGCANDLTNFVAELPPFTYPFIWPPKPGLGESNIRSYYRIGFYLISGWGFFSGIFVVFFGFWF